MAAIMQRVLRLGVGTDYTICGVEFGADYESGCVSNVSVPLHVYVPADSRSDFIYLQSLCSGSNRSA